MTTFRVDRVQSATSSLPPAEDWARVIAGHCGNQQLIPEAYALPKIGYTPLDGGLMNGLVEAIHRSYSYHYLLVLSPDHIWMCIVQGFATHVNQNAENLRNLFVEHEGKKTIIVRRDDFVKGSPHNPWPEVFSEFSVQIRSHIGEKTHDLLTPTFTTTGPVEKAAAEIVLMDAFKEYYDYSFYTLCGIPQITLEGTVDDWKQLRERALGLAQFDLQWWIDPLKIILDQFVAAKEGHVNKDFWSSIYKVRHGSGGPFFSGWIIGLFPYIEDGKTKQNSLLTKKRYKIKNGSIAFKDVITTEQLVCGVVATPFVWEYQDKLVDMHFFAGFMGTCQDPMSLAIHPFIGWAVVNDIIVSTAKKY